MRSYSEFPTKNGRIVAIFDSSANMVEELVSGMKGCLLTDITSFFAEQGGQLYDTGVLYSSSDVRKIS